MAITTDPLKGLLFTLNGSPNARWNSVDGETVNLSYHFLSSPASYYTGSYAISNFRAFNSYEKTAALAALANFSSITKITFSEDASMGASTDITFGVTSSKMSSNTFAYAYIPTHTASGSADLSGDVWVNVAMQSTASTYSPSGYGYLALIHEMGHAMGLKHPFEGTNLLDPSVENRLYTVMSYTAAPKSNWLNYTANGGSYSWSYSSVEPETFMLYDVMALQQLYGANNSYATGNDTYTFDPTKPFFKTIWDAGGTDTIDASAFSLDSKIDLTPGGFSTLSYQQSIPSLILANLSEATKASLYNGTNNLTIAYGVTIERALAGSGNDLLTGNSAANYLSGGAGNDTLSAALGNDTLDGGAGNDVLSLSLTDGSAFSLTGGAGQDTYRFASVNLLSGSRNVTDFTAGTGGDLIDLEKPLIDSMSFGYSSGNPFEVSLSYLKLVQSGSNTLLQWDKDGTDSAYSFQTLLTLNNLTATSLTSANFVQSVDPTGSGDYTPDLSAAVISVVDTSADDKFVKQSGTFTNPFGLKTKFSLVDPVTNKLVTSIKTIYGVLTLNATTGSYAFTVNDLAVEGLNDEESFSQTFGVKIINGTSTLDSQLVLNVAGANDLTVFTGSTLGSATEDTTISLIKGKLVTKDRDTGSGAVMTAKTETSSYGTFSIDATGAWTYQLNNSSAQVQALSAKATTLYADEFTVLTADGSSKIIGIKIKGADDPTSISGDTSGAVIEDTETIASGSLQLTDIDNGEDVFVATVLKGKYGSLEIDEAGAWTYSLNNDSAIVQALTEKNLMKEKFSVTTGGGVKQSIDISVQGLGQTITGTSSSDVIVGSVQDDLIKGGLGADTMTGGTGHDWYEVDSVLDQVIELANGGIDRISLKLADKTVMSYSLPNYVENLTLTTVLSQVAVSGNAENNHILGSALANKIAGLTGNDLLSGVAGNDTLDGGSGMDILVGGAGLDALTGGAGVDAFVFDQAVGATNIDTITDFSVTEGDHIYLNLSVFKGLGKVDGSLQASQFVAGGGAVTADQRMIYDVQTGQLFYDADGTGKGAQVLIATLSNYATGLSASSFVGYLPATKDDLSAVIVGVQSTDSVTIY